MARQPRKPPEPLEGTDQRYAPPAQLPLGSRGGSRGLLEDEIEALQPGRTPNHVRTLIRLTVAEAEAADFAERFRLDAKRLWRVFERIVRGPLPTPVALGGPIWEERVRSVSHFEEAAYFLPPSEALALFEETDPVVLTVRSTLVDYLIDSAVPCYRHVHLADLLSSFALHLERNLEHLVKTGYPGTSFEQSPWLDGLLTLSLPVTSPVSFFEWPESLDQPGPSGPGVILNGLIYRAPVLLRHIEELEREGYVRRDPHGNFVYHYRWQTGDDERTLITGLTGPAARDLEAGRQTLLDAKQEIIRICAQSLRSGDAAGLWPGVENVLRGGFNREQMRFYLGVDDLCRKQHLGLHLTLIHGRRFADPPGCMTSLLTFVGHVEKEIQIGTFDRTATALSNVLGESKRCESYFEAARLPNRAELDKALDGFWLLRHQERTFWAEFERRVNESLLARLRRTRAIYVDLEPELETKFQLVEDYVGFQATHLNETGSLAPLVPQTPELTRGARRQVQGTEAVFPTLAELRWEEVSITLLTEDSIKISARKTSKTYTFAEIGLRDRRTHNKPNAMWTLLKALANSGGSVRWGDRAEFEKRDRIKATFKGLRAKLKAIIGIADDPFEPYRKVRAYKAKFHLIDAIDRSR
jgi:hypothetical protein